MDPAVSPSSAAAAAGQVRGHGGHALRKAHGPAATADGILEKVSTRVPAYYTMLGVHSRT